MLTEDDFLPCGDLMAELMEDIARIPGDFTSYRCSMGLGCLLIQRKDLRAFVEWARINIAVSKVDTLSSVFFAKEDTGRLAGKFAGGVDGRSYFDKWRSNYVKRTLRIVHIGHVSTFGKSHAAVSTAVPATCDQPFDTRSPVEDAYGVSLDKFDERRCAAQHASPCVDLLKLPSPP